MGISYSKPDNIMYDPDPPFKGLPTELFIEIFKHICLEDGAKKSSTNKPTKKVRINCPTVTLAQVCKYWRNVVLGTPSLWTNLHITNWDKRMKVAARTYLERSQSCPLSLTLVEEKRSGADGLAVLNDLIVPFAERCYRMSVDIHSAKTADPLLAGMQTLDFPILLDFHIRINRHSGGDFQSDSFIIKSAPRLRRCKFVDLIFVLPLPSNLVVLDYQFPSWRTGSVDIFRTLLDFFPHVAHSLEHLRFFYYQISPVISHRSKILLQNLKSLVVRHGSCVIMDYIITPSLTSLSLSDGGAESLHGFPAPRLRSLDLTWVHLQPLTLLTPRGLPSTFPQLESVVFHQCYNSLLSIPLLLPPEPNQPLSLQDGSKHPPEPYPFPKLKQVTIVMGLPQPGCGPSLQALMKWPAMVDQDTHNFIKYLVQRLSDSRGIRLLIMDTRDWQRSKSEVFM